MTALDHLLLRPRHVVAQVVEAELVVGAVRDIGVVGLATLGRGHVGEDHADLEPEEAVDPAHPLRVALGEVVVDGDDVDALAREGVEVGRQRGDERLALTGAHLGDVAQVEGATTHDLDVVVPLAERPLGRLTHRGEGLGQEVVERLPRRVALLVLVRQRPQLGIAERDEVLLDRIHGLGHALELAQGLALAGPEDLVEHSHSGAAFRSGAARP